MAKINLLPWRVERRAQQQRDFYGMLGLAAVAGLLLSILLWFHYDRQITGQTMRNDFLKEQIQKVESQITEIDTLDKQKDRLLARKKVIEQLQANRSQMVHLFDSLVRTIPDGVALSNIKQDGETLTLDGRAQSNARVSEYMRNLEGSGWMTKPDLSIIEAKAEDGKAPAGGLNRALPYAFSLKVKLANPSTVGKSDSSTPEGSEPSADNAPPAPVSPAPAVLPADAAAPAQTAPAPAPAADGNGKAAPGAAPVPAPSAPAPAATPSSPSAAPQAAPSAQTSEKAP